MQSTPADNPKRPGSGKRLPRRGKALGRLGLAAWSFYLAYQLIFGPAGR